VNVQLGTGNESQFLGKFDRKSITGHESALQPLPDLHQNIDSQKFSSQRFSLPFNDHLTIECCAIDDDLL
jgi:phage gp36-like protein